MLESEMAWLSSMSSLRLNDVTSDDQAGSAKTNAGGLIRRRAEEWRGLGLLAVLRKRSDP